MSAPTRPVLRYHGGKWRLAPWLIGFFPPHRTYVEPFGGAASVLLRKERAYAEVYNDLDDAVVNVFRVLRDPAKAARLRRALELTPFARTEYLSSYDPPRRAGDVERAHRMIIRAFMGFGSASATDDRPRGMRTRASTHRVALAPTGFRSNVMRSGTTPAHDWAGYPSQIDAFCARLAGVVIEQRAASTIIATHDGPETLIYCDPPYPHATRSAWKRGSTRHAYRHELTDDDHRALAQQLRGCRGMVAVSGYPCDLYDRELYADWERHERAHLADGARTRTEVVWLNSACSGAPDVVLHIDHVHPASKGGRDSDDNLVTACRDCNLSKSDRVLAITPAAARATVAHPDRCRRCGVMARAVDERPAPAPNFYSAWYACACGHAWSTTWSIAIRATPDQATALIGEWNEWNVAHERQLT